jgi:hypothetical protein
VLRSGGRLTGRLGGRRVNVRLPGYGSAAGIASAGRPAAPQTDPRTRVFWPTFVAKSSHLRLVSSPDR